MRFDPMGLPHYSNTIDRPTTHFLSLIPLKITLSPLHNPQKKCNLLHFLLFYSTKYTIFAVKSEIYYTMKCGNLIKQRRAVLGLTQQDLSDYTGLSLRIIKSIEADKGNPSMSTLEKISDVLGLEIVIKVKGTSIDSLI